MSNALEKAKAKEKIIESIRDLYSAKITLPLGNPNLKLVHTNQFLFTELPEDMFELANLDKISEALNSTYSRYSGYVINRWYIEGITINNDGNKATMELDLNPFASTLVKFRDDKQSFGKAYTDALSSENNNKSNSKTTSKKTVKSVSKKVDIGKAVDEVGRKWHHIKYSHCCQSASATKRNGAGDCWGISFLLACELKKRGVKAKILNYPTSMSSNHRSVQYQNAKGKWVNFPYRKYGFHSWFNDTGGVKNGRVISIQC